MAGAPEKTATPGSGPIDVRAEQLAGVYGKALLAAAEKAGATAAIVEQFDALVNELFAKTPSFEAVLAASDAKDASRLAMIDRVFAGRVSQLFVNFLKVLATRGRLGMLRAIHRAFQKEYESLRGRVRVLWTSDRAWIDKHLPDRSPVGAVTLEGAVVTGLIVPGTTQHRNVILSAAWDILRRWLGHRARLLLLGE